MPVFQSKKYIPSSASSQLAVRYRASLSRHPFMLFGLPFLFTIVAGSFFLTPATAIRYEKHDRKVRQMTEDERLGLKNTRGRKVSAESAAEEYYVSCGLSPVWIIVFSGAREKRGLISRMDGVCAEIGGEGFG